MKATAFRLRQEDARRWTQVKLASELGVDQATVSRWFTDGTSNMQTHNTCTPSLEPASADLPTSPPEPPDARKKTRREQHSEILQRVESGEPQSQVAADYAVSQQQISSICQRERERRKHKARVEGIARRETAGTFDVLYGVVVIDPPWPGCHMLHRVLSGHSVRRGKDSEFSIFADPWNIFGQKNLPVERN